MDAPARASESRHQAGSRFIRFSIAAASSLLIVIGGAVPAIAAGSPPPSGGGRTQATVPGAGFLQRHLSARVVKPHKTPVGQVGRRKAHVRGGVPGSPASAGTAQGRPAGAFDIPKRGAALGASTVRAGAGSAGAGDLDPSGNFENLANFNGGDSLTDNCGCEPPDTQVATGFNQVFEPINLSAFVYDRGGNQLGHFNLTDLFQPPQPPSPAVQLSDPKVLFDPTAGTNGRYYLTMMVCQNAACGDTWTDMGISVAISQTDDPLGNWWVYDYVLDTKNLLDQEKLGFSGDKVTFAVNEYTGTCGAGSCFKQEDVVVMPKTPLLSGSAFSFVIFSTNSFSSFVFDSMPTTPINASTTDNTQYVVWNGDEDSNNTFHKIGVIRITGLPGGTVNFNLQTASLASFTSPPAGVQPGTCFDNLGNQIPCTIAGDKENFQSSVVQGNDLWTVATDGCTPQYPNPDTASRACTRLVEVDLSNGGASVVTDTDVGTDGTYRYNPSVSKDATGHMYFGFTISSSTMFATAALDAGALPIPAVFERIDYASGDATYVGSRWGDYSGTQQDPGNTGDVWSAQEFGACATACSSNGGNWATRIGQFTFDDPQIKSVVPNSGPATGSTTVDIFGADFANGATGGTSVNFGATPAQSVTWINAQHIQAVSPAHGSGTVDITATTFNGTSETSSNDLFTFDPVVSSVSPDFGPSVGGQTVSIGGAGFIGTTAVHFGATAASSFSVIDDGLISAVTPAHAPGTVDVTVTANGATSLTSAFDRYTFRFPTTTTLASSANPSMVGASVTFTATVSPVPDGGTVAFSDKGSPIAGCSAKPVDTSTGTAKCTVTYATVGSHSIVAAYSGDHNYAESTSAILMQQVAYAIKVLYTQTKVNNSGATVPIKVELDDAFGNNVSSASIVLTVSGLSPNTAPGIAPSGNFTFMTFDTGPGYQLNVKTTRYPSGTYTLSFTVTGDPTTHSVQFVIG